MKEMRLNEWLELSRKWREMNKEMNKTPNAITEREVGTCTFKDMLRGGIWSAAIPGVIPGSGGSLPDTRIGVDLTRVTDVRRIVMRDVVEIVNIVARVGRHVTGGKGTWNQ